MCAELLERVAGEHRWRIVAKEIMPDHVHLFMPVSPADTPASGSMVRGFIECRWVAVA